MITATCEGGQQLSVRYKHGVVNADNLNMKPLEEQTFTDDFMFGWVIQHDSEICRQMLECLLGIRINRIGYLNAQEREQSTYTSKAVCFDVYADDGRVFDVEMQTTSQASLVQRARYYQSVIDTEQLTGGNNYALLKDSYVIFICTFDPFKKGEAVYDVKRVFAHDRSIEVPNGAHELYFNATAYDKAKDVALSAFLRYISTKEARSMLTQEIDTAVEYQKMQKECRLMYAHLNAQWMDDRMEAREEGIAWQKAQSQAEIDRMTSDMKRMANDNARMANEKNSIIAAMQAEIAALKAAASRPSK